jgi:purine-binding chemotaxis protein CheW
MQYLTFRLGGVEYAVDVKIIETVVQFEGATAVPSPLGYVIGVMDLRGQVIPLIELRKKLGLEVKGDLHGTSVIVFVVGKGDDKGDDKGRCLTIGAVVDTVSEVVDIDEDTIKAASGEGTALWERYVRGVARLEGRMVVILSPEGLFSLGEIQTLRGS